MWGLGIHKNVSRTIICHDDTHRQRKDFEHSYSTWGDVTVPARGARCPYWWCWSGWRSWCLCWSTCSPRFPTASSSCCATAPCNWSWDYIPHVSLPHSGLSFHSPDFQNEPPPCPFPPQLPPLPHHSHCEPVPLHRWATGQRHTEGNRGWQRPRWGPWVTRGRVYYGEDRVHLKWCQRKMSKGQCVKHSPSSCCLNRSMQLHTVPPDCSPLTTFPSIGLPLPAFSSSSTSSDATEAPGFPPQSVEKGDGLPPGLAEDMADKLEELLVAVPGFTGQSGGGRTLSSLLLHELVLPLLGLWELGGDHHEAQVDHEEGTHLGGWESCVNIPFLRPSCLWSHQELTGKNQNVKWFSVLHL